MNDVKYVYINIFDWKNLKNIQPNGEIFYAHRWDLLF